MNTFFPGAITMLKSGGPMMTVINLERDMLGLMIYCKWFTDGSCHSARFTAEALFDPTKFSQPK